MIKICSVQFIFKIKGCRCWWCSNPMHTQMGKIIFCHFNGWHILYYVHFLRRTYNACNIMHPNKRKMLNSLQELSELNVSFHMSDNLAEYQTGITHMLR